MALSLNDPLSYGNSEDYVTEHVHFDWNIDFDKQIIHGSVILTVKNLSKKKADFKLDSKYLDIKVISVNGLESPFKTLDVKCEHLGSCLVIPVSLIDERFEVKIEYSTTDQCTALQWLIPEATLGKKYPYLYSQCQAIHARTLFPCQDTPSVKSTFSAQVKADGRFNVLMSGIKQGNPIKDENFLIHLFEQNIRIPSYLVAIVCGNIDSRKIGERSAVWSEREMVDAAAKEFSDTEKFLSIAEDICGPYVWGRYDLLVLPPSFPYGGMENPCLTFVTPTLIVGDKSLVNVVAHEISHSWTGNLVSNKTWDDFWLNEGHTRYVERLIMEKHHESESMRHLLIDIGLAELQESLDDYKKGHAFNALIPELVECDPDDSFSRVPYEKGSNLLFYLESICGKAQMMRWVRAYFEKYKNTSLSSEEWKIFFFHYMTSVENCSLADLENVNWEEWFHGRWKIPVSHELNREFALRVENLVDKWIKLNSNESNQFISEETKHDLLHDYQSMKQEQKYYFLQVLNNFRNATFHHKVLDEMGTLYNYKSSKNSEILFGWSILCIRSQFSGALDQIFEFLYSQGRLKFTKPIYKHLIQWDDDHVKRRTLDFFQNTRKQLHPITVKVVKKILKLED